MTDKEVMQMVLDALESLQAWPETPENFKRFRAIDALQAALAQPEPEPVAILILGGIVDGEFDDNDIEINNSALERLQERLVTTSDSVHVNLYTAPPQRKEWIGLTADHRIACEQAAKGNYFALYAAIEAMLKEKNGF